MQIRCPNCRVSIEVVDSDGQYSTLSKRLSYYNRYKQLSSEIALNWQAGKYVKLKESD